jgi:hypothetical protein
MNGFRGISLLVIVIALLAFIAAGYGVFSTGGEGESEFTSLHGETVQIHGKGLYRNDSVSMAAQAIGQDLVTLVLGIPLLLVSLYRTRKGSIRGRLLLAGTLGYFLYAYASYSFLATYNNFFLLYVALFSTSLFAFIFTMLSFNTGLLKESFAPELPVKRISGFLFFLGGALGLLWLGRILPPLLDGGNPVGIEHYTTLVIQAMDLAVIVPFSILAGVLLLRRNPAGYLLSSVLIMKGLSMCTALTAMIMAMLQAGEKVTAVEIIIFPVLNLFILYFMYILMKHVRSPAAELKR